MDAGSPISSSASPSAVPGPSLTSEKPAFARLRGGFAADGEAGQAAQRSEQLLGRMAQRVGTGNGDGDLGHALKCWAFCHFAKANAELTNHLDIHRYRHDLRQRELDGDKATPSKPSRGPRRSGLRACHENAHSDPAFEKLRSRLVAHGFPRLAAKRRGIVRAAIRRDRRGRSDRPARGSGRENAAVALDGRISGDRRAAGAVKC